MEDHCGPVYRGTLWYFMEDPCGVTWKDIVVLYGITLWCCLEEHCCVAWKKIAVLHGIEHCGVAWKDSLILFVYQVAAYFNSYTMDITNDLPWQFKTNKSKSTHLFA